MTYAELVMKLRKRAKELPERFSKNEENIRLFLEAADAIEDLEFACNRYEKDYKDLCAYLPKWIPVTERLPMIGEKAICFGKNGYMIGTYGEFGWMFPCYFGNVTHWMPLPEPPKEG